MQPEGACAAGEILLELPVRFGEVEMIEKLDDGPGPRPVSEPRAPDEGRGAGRAGGFGVRLRAVPRIERLGCEAFVEIGRQFAELAALQGFQRRRLPILG